MLQVKTKLGMSSIQGIGVYADEFIPKGTVVWRFMENLDRLIPSADLEKMPLFLKEYFERYIFLDAKRNAYVFCVDDGRFMNHQRAGVANCGDSMDSDETVALRDIEPGEELTVDYEAFDPEFNTYKDTYRY